MLKRTPDRARSYDAQMLAAADRLFLEFDDLPVLTVVRSINSARARLRERGEPASPAAIEAEAREHLRDLAPCP